MEPQLRGREIRRDEAGREVAELAPGVDNSRADRDAGVGAENGYRSVRGDCGEDFDALAGGELLRRAAVGADLPDVTAVDVVLIRGIKNGFAVRADGDVLYLEGPRRQLQRHASVGGDGVEVFPSGDLPGKDEAIVGGPVELRAGSEVVEDAALPLEPSPGLVALTAGDVDDADGPWLGGAAGLEVDAGGVRRHAEEGDLAAVRGPGGLGIFFRSRVKIRESVGRKGEDADEAVVAAAADKGQSRSVGRPGEGPGNAAALKERDDVAKLNANLQQDLAGKGLAFNKTDATAFRDKLRSAGFYTEWKGKYGDEAWAILEKSVGKLS